MGESETVVWECVQDEGYMTEYDAYVDISNGYDVFHRLTLMHDKRTAYMTIAVMDEGGPSGNPDAHASLAVPYDVAVKMTGYVPEPPAEQTVRVWLTYIVKAEATVTAKTGAGLRQLLRTKPPLFAVTSTPKELTDWAMDEPVFDDVQIL